MTFCALWAFSLSAPAGAQPRGEHFDKIDLNRNGKVTLDEVQKHAASRFKRLDTNKDNSISKAEF